MRIVARRIVRIGGALARPLAGRWVRRDGVLLLLTDEDGRVGRGEASPLPDYSTDSLDACEDALATIEIGIGNANGNGNGNGNANGNGNGIEKVRGAVEAIDARLPAARFALETALLDLAAQRAGVPAHRLLGGGDAAPSLCALVDDVDSAGAALACGAECLKVKVSGGFTRGRDTLRAIRRRFPRAPLRADANRALPPSTAREQVAELAALGLEYVEEPTGDWSALDGLAAPLAAD